MEPTDKLKEWSKDAIYLGDAVYFRVDKEQFRGILFTADGIQVIDQIYLEPGTILVLTKMLISTFNIDKSKL